ncbi:hypothetical protein ACH419_32785 [Streptomyces bobili]|uniref:hypothetical protein n=1 Tax=Streptomyces bobili TaxID=67280 RepID=UPI0037907C7C
MADRAEDNDESAEAKNPAEEPGTSRPRAHSVMWLGIGCHALGILYYGSHLAHAAWLKAQDLVNPLVQHLS